MREQVLNAISIDLEEWFCSHNLQSAIRYEDWDALPKRADLITRRLLDQLDFHGVKATFFVLGWLAARYPELVFEVQKRGHEIASHGYAHRLTWHHTPASFALDLEMAEKAIHDASGCRPGMFRAPAFSITRRTLWATAVLKDKGYYADSSVFPLSWHPEYGIPEASLEPFIHPCGLQEIPMSVVEFMGRRWPVSGGAYFRHLPYPIYKVLIDRLHRQGRPLLFYLHPWELDAEMPVLPGLGKVAKFRHYAHTGSVKVKLDRLLSDFAFAPVSEVYASFIPKTHSSYGFQTSH